MSVTVLIALALHGGIVMWLALPTPAPPAQIPAPPLRVSLLSAIAETTVARAAPVAEPPPPKQAPEPAPESRSPVEARPEIATPAPPSLPVENNMAPLDAVATAQYEQLFVAWLRKHKRYPRRAKRLRIEGEGMLRILIDRTGRTQQISLEQRTGNRLLDQAALEMAQRADPFPPLPENDPRRELEFIVPVAFVLDY